MNRIRGKGLRAAWTTLLCVLLVLCVSPHMSYADDAKQVAVPEDAQQVWVDVESQSAADLQVKGSMNADGEATTLAFKPSPNGVTAIAPVNARTVSFALSAGHSGTALVSITFVDKNDVILAESATNVTLTQNEETIAPVPPSQPAATQPDTMQQTSHKTVSPITEVLQNTGVTVSVAVLAVVALAGAGVSMVMLRRSGSGRHALKGDRR